MGEPNLAHLISGDGAEWKPAEPFTFVHKSIELSDGSTWKPHRVERPFVLTDEKGKPEWIYLAIKDGDLSGNIAAKLEASE